MKIFFFFENSQSLKKEDLNSPEINMELLSSEIVELKSTKTNAVCHFVPTAHISTASCDLVTQAIHHYKPQYVAVELCRERVGMLFPDQNGTFLLSPFPEEIP
jgi:hypothetical protein